MLLLLLLSRDMSASSLLHSIHAKAKLLLFDSCKRCYLSVQSIAEVWKDKHFIIEAIDMIENFLLLLFA